MPNKKMVRRPRAMPTPDVIARDLVATLDLAPDYTDLETADVVAAYIQHHVDPDQQASCRDLTAKIERTMQTLRKALLDESLRHLLVDLDNDYTTKAWLHEEAVYLLGIAIGQRIGGA